MFALFNIFYAGGGCALHVMQAVLPVFFYFGDCRCFIKAAEPSVGELL